MNDHTERFFAGDSVSAGIAVGAQINHSGVLLGLTQYPGPWFPGGCVSYTFDFALGSQIALMEQFEEAVGLYPRQQLRLVLKQKLGVELNP